MRLPDANASFRITAKIAHLARKANLAVAQSRCLMSSTSASPDPAAREKALASQLRRRAMASRATRAPNGDTERGRELSRTPPTSSSAESSPAPPPRSIKRSGTRSRSRSRSLSPGRDRRIASRRDDHRDRDRTRRRSGRDLDAADAEYVGAGAGVGAAKSPSTSSAGRRAGMSIRGTSSRREGSSVPAGDDYHSSDDEVMDNGDGRSARSARIRRDRDHDRDRSRSRSRSHRADSRGSADDYRPRRRRRREDERDFVDRERYHRHRSARQDSYGPDPYYRSGSRDHRRDPYDYYSYGDRPRRRRSPSPASRPSHPPPAARRTPTPERDDYELRSVFCSQLAARLTQRDLGEFFEEKLGEDTVKDVRIVSDRITGRSKGIGYVELVSEAIVEKAIALTGQIIFGIPILVQRTEAARNRGQGASTAQAPIRPNMAGAAAAAVSAAGLPLPPHLSNIEGNGTNSSAIHLQALASLTGQPLSAATAAAADPAARLYVGNLHFNLTESNIRDVFAPFGEIEDVDLHHETTGKSKGFAFVQYKRPDDADQAIAHMNGFDLAGRNIRVGHSKSAESARRINGTMNGAGGGGGGGGGGGDTSAAAMMRAADPSGGDTATLTSAFDEGGGGGLNAQSRANLMQMLARTDANKATTAAAEAPAQPARPSTIPQATSRAVLLKNMFNPEEETDADWDTDLAEDVKGECASKYGDVELCHVEKESSLGEIYLLFAGLNGAAKGIAGLNGRFFGGKQVSAEYISESFLKAKLG